jgi:hypothetical protein
MDDKDKVLDILKDKHIQNYPNICLNYVSIQLNGACFFPASHL